MAINNQISTGIVGTPITNPTPEPGIPTPTPTNPSSSLTLPVPPEPTPPPPTITFDLSALVLINPKNITIDYRKNSMTAIPSNTISLTNLSNDIDIIIGIQGLPQVSITPNNFTLKKPVPKML